MKPETDVIQVKVIGSGGIGLSLMPPLCRMLNYSCGTYGYEDCEITLIDGDEFEERNRDRQSFDKRGNKAEVTIAQYKEEYPNLFLNSYGEYITEDNISSLIKEEDVIFLCVDNHKTRKLVSSYCSEKLGNVTVISGGNDYHDGSCQIHIRRNGVDLTLPIHSATDGDGKVYHPEIANPNDKHPDEIELREGCLEEQASTPQLLVANNMAAALMLNAFYGLLTDVFDDTKNALVKFKYTQAFFDCRINSVRAEDRPV